MLNRSLEMIISILAVLKSGGSYIPIDPEYPEERVSYMLSQSKSKVLLSQKHLENKIKNMNFEGKVIYADLSEEDIYNLSNDNLEKISKPSDLSYIIYTSGSTGTPKGVMLTQKTFSNFIASMFDKIEYLNDNIYHSIISITTVSFDIFAFETLTSLCSGLKLFITDELEQKATIKLEQLLIDNNIEIIQSTPSVMNFHLENSSINGFSKLKYVMLAGEQLPKQLVDKLKAINPNITVYDGYGPSETTIFSAVYDVTNLDKITIGKPIANTKFYILGEDLSLLPPNTVGEIYIGGDGVGRGYLGRPDLTEKSYLSDPFTKGSIMYKTGDLGLWNEKGILECMGRCDHQVKLRGLRIELGEIEECINSFDPSLNVKSAVIIKEINGRKALNAFISSSSNINLDELKKFLASKLTRYMLPNTYTFIDKLPFTPNGKIDRKALLNYEISSAKKVATPENDVSKYLINELQASLKIDNLSANDSFFEIGGDSLVAIKLCTKISNKYKMNFNVQDIFEHPIIKDMADIIISKKNTSISNDLYKTSEKNFYHLSSAQKRIYYSAMLDSENSILYNVPSLIVFDRKPNKEKLNECFQKLIQKHSSLRTYFEEIDGEVYQKVLPKINFNLEEIEVRNLDTDTLINDFVKPFKLSSAPLFRANLVHQSNIYMLLFDIHHIICDGTSLSIFTKELSRLYNDEPLNKNLSFDYIDYAEWEFEELKKDKFKNAKEFWLNEFSSNIPSLDFPTDFIRPPVQSFEGAKIHKEIGAEFTNKITDLSKSLNVSNFILLLTIYYILLYKYSNNKDIVVGVPTAGRDKEELWNVIGMFVNTLPIKNHIDGEYSFTTFLNNVKETSAKCFSNGAYPFDSLVNDLRIPKDISRTPLFDTAFIYQNDGFNAPSFDGIKSKLYMPNTNISKFDFSLEVIPESNGELGLNFEYCTKLFKHETIEKFAIHFMNIIQNVIDNPDVKIKDINIKLEKNILNQDTAIENNMASISACETESFDTIASNSKNEKIILDIFKKVLGLDNISENDNFFELGGDSLTAMKVHMECNNKGLNIAYSDIFKFQTAKKLAKNISDIVQAESTIKRCAPADFYPTSSAQKRMYLANLMDANSTFYNIIGGILLDSVPDINKLQKALDILISRHEALRTHFELKTKQIIQVISDNLKVNINIQNANTNDFKELFYIYESTFDLSKAPLFNVTLFYLPNGKVLLMLDIHHIIFDGASLNNFIYELSNIYNEKDLPKLDISYKDFAVWENDMLATNGFKDSKKFWLEKLSGNLPILHLPTKISRPKIKSYDGKTYIDFISKELTEKINNFACNYDVTPYMIFLSAYYILLNKYTDDEDLIVGTPTSARLHNGLENLIGMFVNTIPLRNRVCSDMSFKKLLDSVKDNCINSFAHQEYPFDVLVNDLKLKKDTSRNLLFDTMFIYQNNGFQALDFSGIPAHYVSYNTNTSKFDISLEILPLEDNSCRLSFEYSSKLFDEVFIGNFAKSYENILHTILSKPDISINSITVIGKETQNSNLFKYNKFDLDKKNDINENEMPTNNSTFNFQEIKKENINTLNQISNNNLKENSFSSFTNINDYDTIQNESYNKNYISMLSPIQKQVAGAFQDLLSVPQIGLDDNFFEMRSVIH